MEEKFMQPLVSVIVPVYNVEKQLVRIPEIEILLIDDASSDSCGEICDNYAAKDARFRVFHNKRIKVFPLHEILGLNMQFPIILCL